MKKSKKPKDFIQTPQYPGGKPALDQFLSSNLRYPKSAFDNKIEGDVEAEYFIDGLGRVLEVNILKNLNPACDAEVVRLIQSLKYTKAITRGVKTKTRQTLTVHFKLPKKQPVKVNYVLTPSVKKVTETKKPISYSINVNFGK